MGLKAACAEDAESELTQEQGGVASSHQAGVPQGFGSGENTIKEGSPAVSTLKIIGVQEITTHRPRSGWGDRHEFLNRRGRKFWYLSGG